MELDNGHSPPRQWKAEVIFHGSQLEEVRRWDGLVEGQRAELAATRAMYEARKMLPKGTHVGGIIVTVRRERSVVPLLRPEEPAEE